MVVTDGADDQTLARDMIECTGARLPLSRGECSCGGARGSGRASETWIRVLGFVQRQARWQRIASPGLLLNEARKRRFKWRVAYTQRRSAGQPLNTAQVR